VTVLNTELGLQFDEHVFVVFAVKRTEYHRIFDE